MADIEVVVTEGPEAIVTVEEEPDTTVTVALSPPVEAIEVEVPGPAGPPGNQGPQGVPGTGVDLYYEFTQSLASASWGPINHALGKFPSVTVVDSANSVVFGDVVYVDENHVTLEFSAPFSGVAYLS